MALIVIREYTARVMSVGRVRYFHDDCGIFSSHTKKSHPILLLLLLLLLLLVLLLLLLLFYDY